MAGYNLAATLLPSLARTITQTSPDIPTLQATNLQVVIDMTAFGTGSVTVTINGKDPTSGKYFLLLAGAAVVSNATFRYKVGPFIVAVANVAAQDYLPSIVQIVVTANNANPATYSVGYVLGS